MLLETWRVDLPKLPPCNARGKTIAVGQTVLDERKAEAKVNALRRRIKQDGRKRAKLAPQAIFTALKPGPGASARVRTQYAEAKHSHEVRAKANQIKMDALQRRIAASERALVAAHQGLEKAREKHYKVLDDAQEAVASCEAAFKAFEAMADPEGHKSACVASAAPFRLVHVLPTLRRPFLAP